MGKKPFCSPQWRAWIRLCTNIQKLSVSCENVQMRSPDAVIDKNKK